MANNHKQNTSDDYTKWIVVFIHSSVICTVFLLYLLSGCSWLAESLIYYALREVLQWIIQKVFGFQIAGNNW